MKNQPEVFESWAVSHSVENLKDILTFTPSEETEGYEPIKMEVTEEQIKKIWRQISASVPFKISRMMLDGKNVLVFQADPEDKKATHNMNTLTISQEQWDTLRFSCMTAVDDRSGITKLCYL